MYKTFTDPGYDYRMGKFEITNDQFAKFAANTPYYSGGDIPVNLASWFEAQGVTVNRVDITSFREATMKLHNGPDATWKKDVYDRLQAIK